MDVTKRRFNIKRWSRSMGYRRLFGPMGSASRRREDPFLMALAIDPASAPPMVVTYGRRDPLLEGGQRFIQLLQSRGFAVATQIGQYGHNWQECDAELPFLFDQIPDLR